MVLTTITNADGCSKDSTATTHTLLIPGRKGMTHALTTKMTLMVCRVSGDPLQHKEFQNERQNTETICLVYQTVDQVLS